MHVSNNCKCKQNVISVTESTKHCTGSRDDGRIDDRFRLPSVSCERRACAVDSSAITVCGFSRIENGEIETKKKKEIHFSFAERYMCVSDIAMAQCIDPSE